jgi:methionine sulfoxide reductase heme-binding subunit
MHVTHSSLDWYAARAAGIAAWVVLSAVVAFGLALAGRAGRPHQPRSAVTDVHRFGGILAGVFVVTHIVTIAIDAWLPFSLSELLIPFTARYRPLFTGLGVMAAELMLAIGITNRLRRTIPYAVWRRVHYLTLVVWMLATVHLLGAGTDRSAPWLYVPVAITAGGILGLLCWRVRLPRVAAAGVGVTAAVAIAAVVLGPLRPASHPWNARVFTDQLSGNILVQNGATRAIVSMAGTGTGAQRVLVRADLLVAPDSLAATALQVEYLPSGAICRGQVDNVGRTSFAGSCTLAPGDIRHITATWDLIAQGRLHGTVSST